MANEKSGNQMDTLIHSAMKKIQAKKENDICRYLPGEKGGYIHHFTMRKMKTTAPEALKNLISKFIIQTTTPVALPPKPRAPRGSRKRRDQVVLNRQDIERMLKMARHAGDQDIIRKLTPRREMRTVKRELIASIKHGRIEHELWEAYVESVASSQGLLAAAPTA